MFEERGSFGVKCNNNQDCTTGNCNQITSTCGDFWMKTSNTFFLVKTFFLIHKGLSVLGFACRNYTDCVSQNCLENSCR